MINRNNESGYALVTVLMIITVFSIVALSFAGQAFTSTKQNKIVEEKAQSVALAEMGVEYFKAAVENAYVESQTEVKKYIEEQIEQDRQQKCENCDFTIDERKYIELATEQMKSKIETTLKVILDNNENGIEVTNFDSSSDGSLPKFKIDEGEDYFVKNTFEDVGKIEISFISTGIETDKEKDNFKLRATFTLDIDDLEFGENENNNKGNEGNDENTEIKLPDFDKIKKPENVALECQNIDAIRDSNCPNILLNGVNTIANGNNIQNKTIYSTNVINFNPHINNMKNTNIHSDERIYIAKNAQNIENSILESKNTIQVDGHLSLINTEVLTGGSTTINGDLTVENNSFVYVSGALVVNDFLRISKGSKVCVRGALQAYKGIKNEGELYVRGSHPYTSDNDFDENCKTNSSTDNDFSHPTFENPNFKWGNIKQDVDYQY